MHTLLSTIRVTAGLALQAAVLALSPTAHASLGGSTPPPTLVTSPAVFNRPGDLDPAFNRQIKAATAVSTGADEASAIAVRPDGRILLGGTARIGLTDDFALVELYANGAPNGNFGTGGRAVFSAGPNDDWGRSIALLPDGKVLLAGTSFDATRGRIAVARTLANGTLDPTFGSSGITTITLGASDAFGHAMAVDSLGRILVAGYANSGAANLFAIVRLLANGAPDTAFGNAGIVMAPVGGGGDVAWSIARTPEGKIVVAGNASDAGATLEQP